MSFQQEKSKGRTTDVRSRLPRIYSIAGMLKDDSFAGQFELNGSKYRFVYKPDKATTDGGRLHLSGLISMTDSTRRVHQQKSIKAILAGIQGGIGSAPPRKHGPVIDPNGQEGESSRALPDVESTGRTSFCGVMYFKLESLNGPALGVSANLTAVQMNVRLAPINNLERDLHGAYSSLIEALAAKPTDQSSIAQLTNELNDLLSH